MLEWPILPVGQEMYKVNLEHLVISNRKEMITDTGVMATRLRSQL